MGDRSLRMTSLIEIDEQVRILLRELRFSASRSAGPGGQHVNKVSTRMTLSFDVAGSPSLSDERKRRIASRLGTRMTKRGVLKLHSQRHRSQTANREDLVERFTALLTEAFRERTPRKKTRPSRAGTKRRLLGKQRRAKLKRTRTRVDRSDE